MDLWEWYEVDYLPVLKSSNENPTPPHHKTPAGQFLNIYGAQNIFSIQMQITSRSSTFSDSKVFHSPHKDLPNLKISIKADSVKNLPDPRIFLGFVRIKHL